MLLTPAGQEELHKHSWAGITAYAGKNKIVDFFDAGQKCVEKQDGPFGLAVLFSNIIRLYKKATGLDLSQYGIHDVILVNGMNETD